MITCRQLIEKLLDFVANELSPEQREMIERHLGDCSPCQTYVETYRITIRLSRQLPPRGLPPGMAERLRAAMEKAMRELHDKGE
jgi:anti-sigma factor RsiW